jgi:hypothetical protein
VTGGELGFAHGASPELAELVSKQVKNNYFREVSLTPEAHRYRKFQESD